LVPVPDFVPFPDLPFPDFVPSIKIRPSELGPGLLLAATGIGVGDMVSSTIAGASYGLTLVWALAAGVVVKLAITEGGARWQLATGSTLIEGWRQHLPSGVLLAFFIYFVIWSYAVSSALVAASALVPSACFQAPS
jgi:Mn2+/Fe2+ NRAMP family transporter